MFSFFPRQDFFVFIASRKEEWESGNEGGRKEGREKKEGRERKEALIKHELMAGNLPFNFFVSMLIRYSEH